MTPAVETELFAPEWRNSTLRDLMRHIVLKHHAYLREELPAIDLLLSASTAAGSDVRSDELAGLTKLFRQFRRGIEEHLKKEEVILFPMIEKLEAARDAEQAPPRFPFGSIAHPISVMEEEHERARQELAQIRSLTAGYTMLPPACGDRSSALRKFQDVDSDLEIHSHLEDEILFPRAIDLERV